MKKKENNSKSQYDKIYLSYNQIIKEYDVRIITDDEYNKLNDQEKKEVAHIILNKKHNGTTPPPPLPPEWFKYWLENGFKPAIDGIKQEIVQLKQEVAHTNSRLDNLVVKNNLKE